MSASIFEIRNKAIEEYGEYLLPQYEELPVTVGRIVNGEKIFVDKVIKREVYNPAKIACVCKYGYDAWELAVSYIQFKNGPHMTDEELAKSNEEVDKIRERMDGIATSSTALTW